MIVRTLLRVLAGATVGGVAAVALTTGGCAGDGPPEIAPVAGEPVGVQLKRIVPPLQTQRFSMLLDFESEADAVFVISKPAAQMIYDRAHTGRRSLRLEPGTERIAVRLSSLMSGRPFPGEWTLVGGFLFSDRAAEVTLRIEGAGFDVPPRKLSLVPNTWTMAMVDISPAATQLPPGASPGSADARLVMTFASPAGATVWCDDFVLINNAQTLVSNDWSTAKYNPTTGAPTTAPWSVSRIGLNYVGEMPRKFAFRLATAEAVADGWKVDEANELRARFTSDSGRTKHLTIYADGRSYWDGQLKGMSRDVRDNPAFVEQQDSPAQIMLPEELGRVNRSTDGDANNDGYNERRGAYEIIANEPRLEMKITPRTKQLLTPVLEVSGLPAGNVLVTIEGRLVERTRRLDDGTLLVELPTLARPTTVNLRVE